MPMPMFQLCLAQQPLDDRGQRGRVVEHALELVSGRALEGAQHLDVGQCDQGRGDPVGRGLLAGAALVDGEHGDAHRCLLTSGSVLK